MQFEEVLGDAAHALNDEPITATYASAGDDTRGLSFLHPAFLRERGLADVPGPNVFFRTWIACEA